MTDVATCTAPEVHIWVTKRRHTNVVAEHSDRAGRVAVYHWVACTGCGSLGFRRNESPVVYTWAQARPLWRCRPISTAKIEVANPS